MLRSINARALTQSRLAPQLGASSVRRLSMAPRPSAIALGKRPAVPPRSAVFGLGVSARHISFFGGKPAPVEAPAVTPLTEETHSASAVVEPTLSTPEATLSTPVPSSDMPTVPAEPPLPPAEHLTSNAPDHQFHSDPSALLPQAPANGVTPTLHDLVANSGLPLEEVLKSPEAVHAAASVADLKLIGLDHGVFNLAGWCRDALVSLHGMTGLPWWATIAVFTLGLRTTLFPLVLKNLRHGVRLRAVQPQMQALMQRINEAKTNQDSSAMMLASANLQKLMKEHNVSPLAPIMMPLMQMPVFLSMFYALRGLANAPLPQLKDGGFSWVTDLTLADPYFILPVTSVLMQLAVFTVGVDGSGPSGVRNARTMAHFRNGMLVLSPLLVGMISQFPAAVLFYWTTTNAFTLIQATFLRQKWVRKLLRIPEPPVVEAPPSDMLVDPNPSIKDTWFALKDWNKDTMESFTKRREAANLAVADRKAEAASQKPVGTAQLYEKVSEPRAPPPSAFESESEMDAAPTREDLKRARVKAARAKRPAPTGRRQ